MFVVIFAVFCNVVIPVLSLFRSPKLDPFFVPSLLSSYGQFN